MRGAGRQERCSSCCTGTTRRDTLGIALRDAMCIVRGMTKHPASFADILSHWKTHAALSRELGVLYVTAQAMRKRKSIGDQHWPVVIEAMARRGINLSVGDLHRMKMKRRAEWAQERTERASVAA